MPLTFPATVALPFFFVYVCVRLCVCVCVFGVLISLHFIFPEGFSLNLQLTVWLDWLVIYLQQSSWLGLQAYTAAPDVCGH